LEFAAGGVGRFDRGKIREAIRDDRVLRESLGDKPENKANLLSRIKARCEGNEAAEKLFSEGVILREAGVPGNGCICRSGVEERSICCLRVLNAKQILRLAQNRRDLRMTLLRVFRHC
jgi:hypothetical protein